MLKLSFCWTLAQMSRFDEEHLGFTRLRKERQVAELEQQAPRTAVTWRAVLIGLVLVTLICIGTPWLELRMGGWLIANFHIPVAPVFILFGIVMLVNLVAWRCRGWLMLSKAEMLTICCMTLVSAAIPSEGMMKFIFPLATGDPYYATAENRYAETFHQYLPPWFWPKDPASWGTPAGQCPKVILWLYEGLPGGKTLGDVPWRAWMRPLAMFSLFIGLMYTLFFCLAVILRKQWDERERLPFPVAQIPLALVEAGGETRGERERVKFLASRAAWVGMLLPFLMHTYNHLAGMATALPMIPQVFQWDKQVLTEPPLNAFLPLEIWFFPSVLAITFLIAREVSFSIWFFFVLMKVEVAIFIWMGYGENWNSFVVRGHESTMLTGQGEGALLVFALFGLWLARGHLKQVVQMAFRHREGTPDQRREAISYRLALIGLAVSLIGMAVWLSVLLGMSIQVVLPLLILVVLFAIGLSRVAAEGGLVHVKTAGNPASLVQEMYGTASVQQHARGSMRLSPKDATLLTHMQFGFFFEFQAFLMPSLMHSFKVASRARLGRFSFVGALIAAVAVATVVSFGVFIWMGYTYQGTHLGFQRWPTYTSQYLSIILRGRPPEVRGLSWVGVGGAAMLALMILRQRFLWLPHPLGYVVFLTPFRINRFWLMLFLGWLFKWAVLKYANLDMYYRMRRFFLGVLVGEFVTVGLWAIMDATLFTYIWKLPTQALQILL